MSNFMMGWDIGGAHLKVVQLDAKGNILHALQLPCPLWKGLDYLERAMIDALAALQIAPAKACHAITMTGELVDLFENRHQGVCEIAKLASQLLGENGWFYAADTTETEHANTHFIRQYDVPRFASVIASANWHASARCVALQVPNALFVDIGSTTTDIIAIEAGKLICAGISDAHRMTNDSLVYTGVVRTPVMALAQKLDFEDNGEMQQVNVAAEYFATMADVYRLTGELKTDDAETADGKGKTPLESARRLARMIGRDVGSNNNFYLEKWIKLAFTCKNVQIQQLKLAMQKQLKPNMTIVGAGAGSFLVQQIAADLNLPFISACEAADLEMKDEIEVCFPAYALAKLRMLETL